MHTLNGSHSIVYYTKCLTYLNYLIYKSECVCACISAIEIQTTAPILMKFGMEILLNVGKIPSWVATPYPHPQGQGALNRV